MASTHSKTTKFPKREPRNKLLLVPSSSFGDGTSLRNINVYIMNTAFIILFVLCVLGFSVSSAVSPTAQSYLGDSNPRIQFWNFVLLAFACMLACMIRLPLGITEELLVGPANFAICFLAGAAIFALVIAIAFIYRVLRDAPCI